MRNLFWDVASVTVYMLLPLDSSKLEYDSIAVDPVSLPPGLSEPLAYAVTSPDGVRRVMTLSASPVLTSQITIPAAVDLIYS